MRIWTQRGGEERGKEACQLTRLRFIFFPLILLMTRDKETMCDLHVQSHDGYSDQTTLRELTQKSQAGGTTKHPKTIRICSGREGGKKKE